MLRAALLLALPLAAQNPLVVISIDGMRPDYVLKADEHNLKIPHLRRILKDGAHATGVRGVLPTVTYPSHTTILTGVWPVKHRIYSNVVFDPLSLNLAGWTWYAEDIAVPTLWDAASKAGLITGSVSWPVSVGAAGIRYNVPEYWRASKFPGEDVKLLKVISTPGLMSEIEKEAGCARRPPACPLRRVHPAPQTRPVYDRPSGVPRSPRTRRGSLQC
jgi:predicted AlkP superfamily pyrophosphatase or phosphodiesterase